MEKHRMSEYGHIPFRAGRFFCVDLKWYFATREGLDQGPFDTKEDAEAELLLYLRDINTYDQRITA